MRHKNLNFPCLQHRKYIRISTRLSIFDKNMEPRNAASIPQDLYR